jgi:FkbM family methyltransferase
LENYTSDNPATITKWKAQKVFIRIVTMHEIYPWNGLELVIRSNSVDQANLEWMEDSLFWKVFQAARISADDVILDLGAHIGSFAVLAAQQKHCRVFAFEPDLESLTLCKINILLNSQESHVTCHQFAIGGETGRLMFYETTENWGHTILQHGGPHNILTGRRTKVACLSLFDALAHIKCDRCAFLKFNIEGAEFDMIENADVNTLCRIGSMVGEIHFDLVSRSPNHMLARLKDSGFTAELIPCGEHRAILMATRI